MKNLPAKLLIYHRRITHLQPTSVRSNAPTRKKTRDTGRSCFEATMAIDARHWHAAIDPRGIPTGICGWLLRFLIFGPRKRLRHIMSQFFMAFSDFPIGAMHQAICRKAMCKAISFYPSHSARCRRPNMTHSLFNFQGIQNAFMKRFS